MSLSELARTLNFQARARWPQVARLPPLLMMSDEARLPDPLAALDALQPGDGIVLRHYDDPTREDLARALALACGKADIRLLIAKDIDLALRVGAHGVHLPEGLAASLTGPLDRPHHAWIITAAAHGADGLAQARLIGADAALLSPVFPTASHPGAPTLGAETFTKLCQTAKLPVYALGGVTAQTGQALTNSDACGIAAIAGLAKPPLHKVG